MHGAHSPVCIGYPSLSGLQFVFSRTFTLLTFADSYLSCSCGRVSLSI